MGAGLGYPTRHLIVLVDGTWVSGSNMDANQRYSNVYKLNLYIDHHNEDDEAQIAFYIPGLGSRHTGRRRLSAGIFAADLPLDVEQAYINICSNYLEPRDGSGGDKIYLFGFSRGAVIARLTAGLISKFGLLYPSKIQHFDVLWDRFIGASDLSEERFQDFRRQNCSDAEIEFVGVFDTVLGTFEGKDHGALRSVFFGDRLLPAKIKQACHILALDETRTVFRPVLWNGEDGSRARLVQIWMPGVHSDVGGGYASDALSRISLYTMLKRISASTTLAIDEELLEELGKLIRNDIQQDLVKINDERTGWVWAKEQFNIYGNRTCAKDDSCQLIHPVCKALAGRRIAYKSEKKQQFRTFNVFEGMKYWEEPFFDGL
jgi:uncharacterized protein (DUF2235 family)